MSILQTLTVLKIGGNVVDNPSLLTEVLKGFSTWGGYKCLVHGGGKIANVYLNKLGIEPHMIEGRRVTDAPTLEVVTMVYAGLINKQLVGLLQSMGCNAIGLSGADAAVIPAKKRPSDPIDYGFAGDVILSDIPGYTIKSWLEDNLTPVFCPLTFDKQSGGLLNTNADTIASSVALTMSSFFRVRLVYCFEKNGVLLDPDQENSVIPTLNAADFLQYKNEGVISAGMIPKLENAFTAIAKGVSEVCICGPSAFRKENPIQGTLIS